MKSKETYKAWFKKLETSNYIMSRVAYKVAKCFYRFLRPFFKFVLNKDYRSIVLLLLFKRENTHQTTTLTYFDRYPEIFNETKNYFSDNKEINILSYGCSTGEEVISLRKYFPDARIIGADINPNCLNICKSHKLDEKISFINSSISNLKKHEPYDAIFCMAVLQKKPHYVEDNGLNNISSLYPFSKFDRQLVELDKILKKEGLLVVHFTQYRVMDSSIALKYEPYSLITQADYGKYVFDKNGELLHDEDPQFSIYKKIH